MLHFANLDANAIADEDAPVDPTKDPASVPAPQSILKPSQEHAETDDHVSLSWNNIKHHSLHPTSMQINMTRSLTMENRIWLHNVPLLPTV